MDEKNPAVGGKHAQAMIAFSLERQERSLATARALLLAVQPHEMAPHRGLHWKRAELSILLCRLEYR